MSQVLEFAAGFVKNVPEDFPATVMQSFIEHPEKYRNLFESLLPVPAEQVKTTLLRAVASSPATVPAVKAFTLNKDALKQANIGYTWGYFDDEMLGMEVGEVGAGVIAVAELLKNSVDGPIMAEIGEDQVEIHLGHWFALICAQAQGHKSEPGPLFVDGRANIAYFKGKGKNAKRRAVRFDWSSGDRCWSVGATSAENPDPWRDGNQVLSRGLSKLGA